MWKNKDHLLAHKKLSCEHRGWKLWTQLVKTPPRAQLVASQHCAARYMRDTPLAMMLISMEPGNHDYQIPADIIIKYDRAKHERTAKSKAGSDTRQLEVKHALTDLKHTKCSTSFKTTPFGASPQQTKMHSVSLLMPKALEVDSSSESLLGLASSSAIVV